MGNIFINFRRGDDPGFTQALYQRLEGEFTAANLFMDVEGHIKAGDDFVEVLGAQVAAADVLLVVIGPRWADLLAARANDPEDFVAIEIAAALEKGKRVIPVLVGGAGMPRPESLPETIRPLARRNAVGLRPDRFRADCQGLVTALKEQLAAADAEQAARTDAERRAAEAERLKREAEEAARLAAAEERARAQALAGLSPDEIRKAEELANWEFIKSRGDPQSLRNHLARFPNGVTNLYALTRLEELIWAGIGARPTAPTLQAYLEEFPQGANAASAQRQLDAAQKAEAERQELPQRSADETRAWGALAAVAAGVAAIGAVVWIIASTRDGPVEQAMPVSPVKTVAPVAPQPPPLTRERRWRLASGYTQSTASAGPNPDSVAASAASLSGGKLSVQTFASGQLVPSFEILDAVSKRVVDLGWAPAYYFVGREPTMTLLSGVVPLGHGPRALADWAMGAGSAIGARVYARFQVVALPCHVMGAGAEWYRREVTSTDNFKGLKFRATGLAASVAKGVGAVPVALAGGDLKPALEKAVVDGATWSIAGDDLELAGVAKFYYWPGWHQPAMITDLIVSTTEWDGMADAERDVLRNACRLNLSSSLATADQDARDRSLRAGLKLGSYPQAVSTALRQATALALAEQARQSDLFKEALDDTYKYPGSP